MPTSARRTRMALIAVAAAVAASVVVAAPAHAADITVTSSADAGAGSLRAALAGAASGDRIVFDPSVTSIVLESALAVTVGVHIDGPGAGLLTISRVAASNFNEIQLVGAVGEDYVLEGLTLDGTGSQAPAIYADLNTDDVTLRDVVVSNQTSIIGGAALYTFQTDGNFLFEDCVFEGNVNVGLLAGAEGGALKLDGVGGDVTIRNGDAQTNNLRMRGVQAAVLMEGRADIRTHVGFHGACAYSLHSQSVTGVQGTRCKMTLPRMHPTLRASLLCAASL